MTKTQEQYRDDLITMMGTAAGRAVMWEMLTRCQVFNCSFRAGDPYASSFNEGMRNAGLALFNDIMQHCPEHYNTMVFQVKERTKQ